MRTKAVDLRRRTLLTVGVSAAAGALLSCGGNKSGSTWRFFSNEEARMVEAITEQLIPAGDEPGAKEAGVVRYIDVQLSRRFKKHRKTYSEGLAGVDAASIKTFQKRFVELTSTQQIEVLNSVEENARQFFQLILAHTRQGFYGDPRHGGNRNMVSWKMVGLPCPPVRGRQTQEDPQTG